MTAALDIDPFAEEWRAIPDHPRYEVSSFGRVRSLVGREPRILRAHLHYGYPTVTLTRQQKAKVHQIVAVAFFGPRPEGMEVRHLDGDRANPRLDNLAYGTRSENQRDAVAHGTHASTKKTHCPQGHEYSHVAYGQRHCRACLIEAKRRFRARRRMAVAS